MSADEVGKMLKAKNNGADIQKPKINITTKGLSRKEVIIPMAKTNTELIINSAHIYTSNINNCLKNSKSDTIVDFIHLTHNRIIITTNKLANPLDLSTIKKYLKNIKNVNSDLIKSPHLPKSKLYMKIIGLSYITKNGVITLSRSWMVDFIFILLFHFILFSLFFFFSFLFLEQLGLGFISHAVTSVTT